MTSFHHLPTEIVCRVLECCTNRGIANAAATSRHLYDIAIPLLYKRQAKQGNHNITFWAAENGRIGTLKHIAEYMTVRVVAAEEWTHLVYDTSGDFDPKTDMVTGWYWTPLHVAAEHGRIDVVEFLLDHGADIDAQSLTRRDLGLGIGIDSYRIDFQDRGIFELPPPVSFSPLVAAIHCRQNHVVKLLLRRGASIEIRETATKRPCGTTALHVAVINGNVEAIKMIIEGGHAGPNDPDADGYPPLLWAAQYLGIKNGASAASMQPLLDLGADINYIAPSDFYPGSRHSLVTILTKRWKPETAEALIALGATPLSDHESREIDKMTVTHF
ncbi:hypothetical protein CEP52_014692 [Fusarium oligoseptatum]|uniref:Uncharacterized protein n=1 Tax=Fusarium oligoseptatum TaxID=2604345 RepID=A0A428SK33_9HYPO|nr:hypothetical protein CEP52_014692 [Fusarium oligoseptatum]